MELWGCVSWDDIKCSTDLFGLGEREKTKHIALTQVPTNPPANAIAISMVNALLILPFLMAAALAAPCLP